MCSPIRTRTNSPNCG
uniref:Uncharacterized protein n=1 Tax=Anguilla anguilla TaxID=7936 RepID=A0A0E9XLY8_ANGAN